MFEVNDHIIYGRNGVCKIVNIGPSPLRNADKSRQFYTLQQLYEGKSTIYTPVDNDKVIMRKVISAEEAIKLIDEIPSMDIISFEENKREDDCKNAIYTYDCRELIRICKTLYLMKEQRLEEGKKITSTDSKYLKMAQDFLLGEFVISLDKSREELEQLIATAIK